VLPLAWCQPAVGTTVTRMRGQDPSSMSADTEGEVRGGPKDEGSPICRCGSRRGSVGRRYGVRLDERQVQDGARAEEG